MTHAQDKAGHPMPDDLQRLLGVITSLAGEVFLLKAELQRLRTALARGQVVDDQDLAAAAASDDFRRFMHAEENRFMPSVLRPFLRPDQVPDVSHLMAKDRCDEHP